MNSLHHQIHQLARSTLCESQLALLLALALALALARFQGTDYTIL